MYFRQTFRIGGKEDKRLGYDRENKQNYETSQNKNDAARYSVGTREYNFFQTHIYGKMEPYKLKIKSRLKRRSHGDKRKTVKGQYKDAMGETK